MTTTKQPGTHQVLTEKATQGHTPGPWAVHPGDRIHVYAYASSGPNAGAAGLICQVFDREFPNHYAANARLIAGAPMLAESLAQIIKWIDAGCDPSGESIANGREALRKAGIQC